ncbi:hypothetical protein MTR67_023098 [Solanum verrucosum]|uniref:Uncharacterized protein n=1 Tax=Solanum verrucosum TaxID=315347 RepID=A0AAF0QUP9_SOLVR|nr:hypothetical protein MTR67_023098 [Solanum verrucosum]
MARGRGRGKSLGRSNPAIRNNPSDHTNTVAATPNQSNVIGQGTSSHSNPIDHTTPNQSNVIGQGLSPQDSPTGGRVRPGFKPEHVWERWMQLWGSDECIKKAEINAKNRRDGREVAVGTHMGGSISIGEYHKKPAIEKGRDPTPSELHLHVHTHGHDGKSFVGERSRIVHPPPVALLFSSVLSLLPPVSSHRREQRDKSSPLSRLSNQQKFAALSLHQLLRLASSKQSTSAAGNERNNISGQLTPTSIHCPSPLIEEGFKKTHVRKKENELDPDVWVEERAERTFYVAENLDSSVQLTPELSTQIWKEKLVGGTHKGRCYSLGSHNDVRRFQSGLESIGSSRQAEALDGVQIAAMSAQIAKLTAALAESEWKRVAEQQSMSETV